MMKMDSIAGWKKARLGDHVDIQTGFPFKSKEYTEDPSGTRLLRGDNIVQGKLRWDGVKRWSDDDPYEKYWLSEGDVVLAMDRPWIEAGLKYARITRRDLPCLLVQRVARLRGINGLSTRYLHYIIGHRPFTDYVKGIWTGVAVPHISESQIRAFSFLLPPCDAQERITRILGTYDDLIENNTQRIKILEQMAQMLHREWFVSFRFPGHEKARIVESELGQIPESWLATTLGAHLNLESGKRPKGGIREETDGVPSIGAENINGIGRHDFKNEKLVPRAFFEEMEKGVVQDRDVALYKDGAYIGKSSYFRDGFPHRECCVNEHVFLLRGHGDRLKQNFLYLWLQQPDTVQAIRATNANAAQPGINQQSVRGLGVVLSDGETAARFDRMVEPMLAEIVNLAKQNVNLQRTRDLLLPKLVSGEISVEQIDREVPTQTV